MFKYNDSILKCPNCGESLIKDTNNKMFSCQNNHCFDIAKQGYINLLMSNQIKGKIHGDSSEMLNARKNILFGGYYKSISNLLVRTIKQELKGKKENTSILDLGCGIGYYLKEIKDSLDKTLINYYGIDISKSGIVEACKLDKSINWVVGSTNKLPYLNNSVDILISIFSPITLTECERVLKKDGLLFVISPNQGHLIELKEIIYPNIILKREDRNELDSVSFIKINSSNLKEVISVKNADLKSLLLMTPHYWKSSIKAKEELYLLDSLDVSIDIELKTYKYKY
ncbi:MAG: 23S rRNA (guanine(745)-N(1))-methyltransferase [Candidatus Izimaplasma bacterium HR2]|nr:MAG: 23S rRNA (guanine(745)-N(1))-methyltransferase [Candidatus Izimaplasma bacterium HR2]